MEQVEENLILM